MVVPHRGVVRLVTNTNYIKFQENDRILQNIAIVFDASTFAIFGSLLNGLTLYPIQKNELLDFAYLEKYIKENKINIINLTVSFFNKLIEYNPKIFEDARVILIGGEEVLPKTVNVFRKSNPQVEIVNVYGPTENSNLSCCHIINQDYKKSVPIGIPVSNSTCYILDKNQNILPTKVPGEIYVGGDGVALGYLNNPELTNKKFIKNPFGEGKLYKTGDLGYWEEKGAIQFSGRIDFQVKIRGFRIELKEIESKILEYGNIQECAVITSGNDASKILVACIASKNNIDTKRLNSYLKTRLPHYMVPVKYICMESLPLNINGKLDTKLLKASINEDVIKEIIPSRNKTDNVIINVLNELFPSTNISITDSFFDLGGDSLSAISFASKLSKEFTSNITVQDIFKHATIKDLSDYISTLVENSNQNTIKKIESKAYYPISSAQKRIYYASNLDNNSTLYNIAGGIIVDQTLDIEKLEQCFRTLIDRHEALRTRFEVKNNNVVQIIEDNIEFNLKLDQVTTEDLNKIYSNFVKPFDLSKAPLFRTKLVQLKNNKMLLLLDMHHIISDGTSLSILLQELCDLYNGSALPEKQIDYKDFTLWEKEQFETDEFKKSKEYWVSEFKDEIPLLNMPTNNPRPSVQNFEGSNYHTKLSKEIFDKVNKIAKQLNITPYMLMLSVYYILLSKYTSQDDIVVGTPIVGRELPELSNTLGMFVNTLALRNKIDHNLTFEKFSKVIKENCLNSFKNQSYPFDMLVKGLEIKRDTSRNPLFDVMFVYQNNGYPKINFENANTEYFIPDNNISKFDLTLEIIPIDNEYSLRFEYCTKLFNEDFIKRLSSHYINILNVILENTEIKIDNIDMLSQKEKNQILYEFNNTKIDYPQNKTVIELFEEQVEKTPDNIAVVFENQKLTYKELNEKSNQLARVLIANNVAIGDMVCILLDKSLEMIVSILSILKVGATFLPIDINYPKERIDYIINDSKSDILLTTQDLINKANDTVQILNVELDNIQYLQYSKENISIKYSTDNLAYVMYTSGSTGKPKGVMVTHKNILRLVKNNKFITFSENEHILQTGSIVFDACTFEIWGALLNGFELYIIEKEKLLDATYLKEYMTKNKITSLFITTQLFNQLIDSDIDIFSNVSNVLTGGEAVSVKHMNKLNLHNKNINVIHCYGPTENTTFSTCYDVKKIKYNYTVPIGKPISNSTAYVVSSSGLLCPIGVPGELWVGGDGVAKGYLNNETLTKEKFISNPFGNDIVYKTGDLVKWLPDGNIEFIGRIDNQVKVRGFRIELSEIDIKILEYPGIKYATTILNTINNEKVICSYFVGESTIDLSKLKEFLKSSLPNYMIPTYMLQLENFKMNINGKIDKKTLPTDFRSLKKTKIIRKPSNEMEEKLLYIYKIVTNIEEISVTDDLFDDLHGDSLIAMKIQVEALSQNINIAYSDIFKYSSIKLLASHLINQEKKEQETDTMASTDFSKYNELLKMNSLEYPIKICNTPITNILLTGFTGFLGAHILDSFIKKEKGTIYCLIRSKNNMTAKERLLNVLHFYFEDQYDKYVGNRIQVIEGDISFDHFGLSPNDYLGLGKNLSTVIHSAALVKHYGMYKDFENANIIGTKNVVDFSSQFNLNLLHISTLSVSGNNFADGSHVEEAFETDVDFAENNFYIGQNVDGLYAKSKFEAEHIVLEAIYSKRLKASILRMGNLTSRFSEGKFQQNHFENAFVNRFKSFLQIGYVPDYMLGLYAEFTPIDYCGDAIIEIARHFNPNYTVFHLMNEKRVYLDRLFDMMKQLNIALNIVTEDEFIQIINNLLADENKKMYIEGIINDFNKSNKHLVYESKVKVKCDFSKAYLEKLGFSWPYIDINYIRNYFKYLENIGYLNINTK